jgi:hypothetical protein
LRLAQAEADRSGMAIPSQTVLYEAEFPSQQFPNFAPIVGTFLSQAHQAITNFTALT